MKNRNGGDRSGPGLQGPLGPRALYDCIRAHALKVTGMGSPGTGSREGQVIRRNWDPVTNLSILTGKAGKQIRFKDILRKAFTVARGRSTRAPVCSRPHQRRFSPDERKEGRRARERSKGQKRAGKGQIRKVPQCRFQRGHMMVQDGEAWLSAGRDVARQDFPRETTPKTKDISTGGLPRRVFRALRRRGESRRGENGVTRKKSTASLKHGRHRQKGQRKIIILTGRSPRRGKPARVLHFPAAGVNL